MPLQFSDITDRAIKKRKEEIIYLPFFFCTPAPGNALDRLTMEAAATAADGIIARLDAGRLRAADSNWSRESDGSEEEEKLEVFGSHCISCSPTPDY